MTGETWEWIAQEYTHACAKIQTERLRNYELIKSVSTFFYSLSKVAVSNAADFGASPARISVKKVK